MKKVYIAEICHEINKAYCEAIGDFSQLSWEEAPAWQRSSALTSVDFTIDNLEAPPSATHESWLAAKKAEGWKYGPVKDVAKKEHPCYVPYEELPLEQKVKDHLFKAVVKQLEPFL